MNIEWPAVLEAYKDHRIARGVRVSVGTVRNWKSLRHFPTSHGVTRDLAEFLGVSQPAIKVAITMYRIKAAV